MLLTTCIGLLFLTPIAASQNATKCFECSDLPHPVYCNKVTTCPLGQVHRQLRYFYHSLCLCLASQNATRCFECSDLPHPVYCNKVTTCPLGQICVVEKRITPTNWELYNSGCQSRERCSANGRRDIPKRNFLARRSDHVVCEECCQGDFCNYQGCGDAAPMQPKRGPMCFQCPQFENPGDCTTLGTCRIGEICMLTELRTTSGAGGPLYKSQCVTQNACQPASIALVGKKRRDNVCHTCCNEDFCNDHCEALVNPTPTTSIPVPITPTATTKITTTAPKTTSTTQPTMKTTTTAPRQRCQRFHYHYDAHSNLCYKFHYERKTWDQGNDICKHEHGTLAIIDTQAKWEYLRYRLRHDSHFKDQRVYIGARVHHHGSSTFYWTSGSRVMHAYWGPKQPNGNEDCIFWSPLDFMWHDVICNHGYMFVCTIQV